MIEFYLGCFILGIIFTVLSFIIGDILDGILDFEFLSYDFFKPTVFLSFLSTFGAAGYLLTKYTTYLVLTNIILSILIASIIAVFVIFVYIKPSKNSENSIGFSTSELVGKLAEVNTTIPANGYGEVIVKVGVGITNYPAKSFEKITISSNDKVVIVEVKDNVLYVAKINL